MSDAPPKSRWRKLGKLFLILVLCGGAIAGALLWYITTDSFRSMVSRRLVAQLERITGGKAEIGNLDISPFQLRVDLRNLTIHGLEKPDEAPYLHVDRLIAELKFRSLFHGDLGFRAIVIDHPTLHLEIYPDGTTNQPSPAVSADNSAQGLNQLHQLFSVSVNRIDVRHGTLLLGNQQVPLDFTLNDLSADTSYSLLHRRYDSNILLGRAELKFEGYQPIAWTAEVHFSVERNRIELQSLKAASRGAHLEASGKLQNFLQPQVEGNYSADFDLARVAAVIRQRDLRAGQLQISGQSSWSSKAFSASGNLTVEDFAWHDANINLHNANLSAKFSADRNRLTFSQIQGHLLGGSTTGELVVANYLPRIPDAKTHKIPQQDGTLRMQLSNLSIAEIADAVSNPHRPFDQIGVVGVTSGSVDTHWKGSPRNADIKIAVDVAAPDPVPPGRLPLDAHARFTYYGTTDELQVEQFEVSTRFTQLHATGAISQKSSLRLAATTTNLGELRPVVIALGGPQKLPLTLKGRAEFNGTVSGKLSTPSLNGNIQANDFAYTVPSTSRTAERQVHWDDLKADIQFSPKALVVRNGAIHHGATEISFALNLGLQKGVPGPNSPIDGRIDARYTDLAEVLTLAGYNYPLRGTVDLHADLSGTKAELDVQGSAVANHANAYGVDIQSAQAQFRLNDDKASFHDISIIQADQSITGSAAYNLSSQAFQFDLIGKGLNLANLPKPSTYNLAVEGRSDVHATGSGTLQEPAINATVKLRDVIVNGQPLGDSTFEARTQAGDLHLTGHSQYEQAQMTTDGTVHLRNDWPCNIKLHFTQVNADPLLRVYIKGRVNSHSLMDGDLVIQGPLRRPSELRINGDFSNITLGVGDVNIHNEGPVRFAVADKLLTIEPFHFTGDRTDLTGNGTIQLTGDRKLNLRTHGRVSLRLT